MEKSEKRQVSVLLLVSIINGLIQTLGVISIMPFIALIAAPEMAQTNTGLLWLQSTFHLQDYSSLLLFCGALTFVAISLSNGFIVLNYGLSVRFFNGRGHTISTELLNRFLKKSPFQFYKNSTAELSKIIFSDVDRVILGSQIAAISIITDLIIFSVILGTLIWVNAAATLITMFALTLTYILVYQVLSNKVEKLGTEFDQLEKSVFSSLKQALNLYKEIRVFGKQRYFVKQFQQPIQKLYRNATRYHVLQFVPIQIVELLVFSIILVLATYLALNSISTGHTITSIAVYAFAAYRIVPVLKSLFESTEEILYASPILKFLLAELDSSHTNNSEDKANSPLTFNQTISFDNVSFSYPDSTIPVLNNVNFSIKKGSMICLKGPSGVGKSTTLDLLLGLYSPNSGNIRIDDSTLNEKTITRWQQNIGYVPQSIQILDDTIYRNIAFGLDDDDINIDQVKRAASLACINQKIETLQDQYHCVIGEGRQTLSGGEKQRIAIARALYSNPKCLILDEASNELDEDTEKQILNNLKDLNITVIFVSHKPSVASFCDRSITLSKSTDLREVG